MPILRCSGSRSCARSRSIMSGSSLRIAFASTAATQPTSLLAALRTSHSSPGGTSSRISSGIRTSSLASPRSIARSAVSTGSADPIYGAKASRSRW